MMHYLEQRFHNVLRISINPFGKIGRSAFRQIVYLCFDPTARMFQLVARREKSGWEKTTHCEVLNILVQFYMF